MQNSVSLIFSNSADVDMSDLQIIHIQFLYLFLYSSEFVFIFIFYRSKRFMFFFYIISCTFYFTAFLCAFLGTNNKIVCADSLLCFYICDSFICNFVSTNCPLWCDFFIFNCYFVYLLWLKLQWYDSKIRDSFKNVVNGN